MNYLPTSDSAQARQRIEAHQVVSIAPDDHLGKRSAPTTLEVPSMSVQQVGEARGPGHGYRDSGICCQSHRLQ